MSHSPESVIIREVCLRDGLQIEEPLPLAAKRRLLAAVVATGVREVEATAFVSPTKVPALADAAELAEHLNDYRASDGVEFSALVASLNGAKRAIAAGMDAIEYVVSASDGHSRANVGRPTADAGVAAVVDTAHDSSVTVEVIIATAWDCPFDGPTPSERVCDVAAAARVAGVDRVCIADTIGTATPRRVEALIADVRPELGEATLGVRTSTTPAAPVWPARTPRSAPGSPVWTPPSAV